MELLRSTKITIEVSTNKQTYSESFDNLPDAMVFYANALEEIADEDWIETIRRSAKSLKMGS